MGGGVHRACGGLRGVVLLLDGAAAADAASLPHGPHVCREGCLNGCSQATQGRTVRQYLSKNKKPVSRRSLAGLNTFLIHPKEQTSLKVNCKTIKEYQLTEQCPGGFKVMRSQPGAMKLGRVAAHVPRSRTGPVQLPNGGPHTVLIPGAPPQPSGLSCPQGRVRGAYPRCASCPALAASVAGGSRC